MNSVPSGIEDDPGVRAYLDSDTPRRAGGIPVIVFDDVNIEDLSEDFRKSDMGRAHDFFDALMTQAFSSGKIVFVVTKMENVARYFESLNEGTKSKVIMRSERSDEGLFPSARTIGWNNKTRLNFLKQCAALKERLTPWAEVEELARKIANSQENIGALSNDLEKLYFSYIESANTASNADPAYDYRCHNFFRKLL